MNQNRVQAGVPTGGQFSSRERGESAVALSASEPLDWEVFDMAHDHRMCLNDNHPAEFGPMSESDARAMAARNPSGYWARKIPSRSAGTTTEKGSPDWGPIGDPDGQLADRNHEYGRRER